MAFVHFGNDMINIIIGCLLGILFHRIFSRVYGSSQAVQILKIAELYSLQLLVWSYEDMIFLKEVKRKTMKDLQVPENQIKVSINIDEVNIKKWKRKAIKKILLRFPPDYSAHIEYRDWQGAMRYLEKVIKSS